MMTPRTPSPNEYLPSLSKDALSFQPSLLQELYEPDIQDSYPQHHLPPPPPQQPPIYRRATFPYVRHDRDDMPVYPQQQQFYPDHFYYHQQPHWDHVKHEDLQPQLIVPSQSSYLPLPPPQQQLPHHSPSLPTLSYLPPHPHSAMPVQHTDDAASKETQYLRRRCFNCHTTEPPSWRRSTLNPGKIVCNKCGLYERTHLRPRPLRFDELRAGNKARKASNAASTQSQVPKTNGGVSPKVKKEPREPGLPRRSSVSSSASSTSGASDWDDNVSVYSAGSAPPTSFNSPAASSFPLSRDSQSPPLDPSLSSSIRLPNAPFSDIASYNYSAQGSPIPSPPLSASLPPTPQILSPSLSLDGHHHHYQGSPHLNASSSSLMPMIDGTTASSSPSLPGTPNTTPRKSHSMPTSVTSPSYYSPQAQQMTLSPQALSLNLNAPSPSDMGGLRRMSVSSTLGSVVEEERVMSLTEELESGSLGLGVVSEELVTA